MSQTAAIFPALATVLVTALVIVEHDREKHIPGVASGPNAETFLVPDHVAESLIKAGAVKRAEVVDADALANVVDTSTLGTQAVSLTQADVAEMVEADKLRAQLADVTAARDNLIEQLADTQEQLAEVNARLAADTGATAASATDLPAAAGFDQAAATDTGAAVAADATATAAADADAAAAADAIAQAAAQANADADAAKVSATAVTAKTGTAKASRTA